MIEYMEITTIWKTRKRVSAGLLVAPLFSTWVVVPVQMFLGRPHSPGRAVWDRDGERS